MADVTLDFDDVLNLCRQVSRFSRIANWKWKGLPVIQWEFPTISDFARARLQMEQVIRPEMAKTTVDGSWARVIDPETFEVDCYGVTFRLTCREKVIHPWGAAGATEVIYTSLEKHEEKLNRKEKDRRK